MGKEGGEASAGAPAPLHFSSLLLQGGEKEGGRDGWTAGAPACYPSSIPFPQSLPESIVSSQGGGREAGMEGGREDRNEESLMLSGDANSIAALVLAGMLQQARTRDERREGGMEGGAAAGRPHELAGTQGMSILE